MIPCFRGSFRAVFLAVLLPAALYGQTEGATISGRVADSSGAIIPRAGIQIVDQATSAPRQSICDGGGEFVFTAVLPGVYTITATAKGFKRVDLKDFRVTASDRLSTGTLTLEVGSSTESVTVAADITPVQNASAERSGLVSGEQISQLLSVGRDVTSLLSILPGVVASDGASSLAWLSVPTINGVRSEYNTVTVDGVVGNSTGNNSVLTPPNLDAIAEVKVLTANYQAEYGKAAGSVVKMITKSGTQQFHGAAYYYLRNEALNANNYFNNLNRLPRPIYRYNTTGGNFGGPVVIPGVFNRKREKLFVFFSQEYLPNKAPDGVKYYTMPTALERQGDFSQTLDTNGKLIPIKDPLNGGAAFAGNIVPSSRINPESQKLLTVFPLPNLTDWSTTHGIYNYVTNNHADQPTSQSILRLDPNLGDNWRMYFRGLNLITNNNGYSAPANADVWLAPVNYRTNNTNLSLNLTWTKSPTLINELSLGAVVATEDHILTADALRLLQRSTYGIGIGQLYPQGNPLGLIPTMSFGGVSDAPGGGPGSRFPMEDLITTYSVTDAVTKVMNRHTLKVGVDAQLDNYLQKHSGGSFSGSFAFGTNTSNPFDTNYAYSNAILGYFYSYSEPTNRSDYKPHTPLLEWYAQDQWRVTSKLTLDYGVRFTWGMAQSLQNGANFVPSLYDRSQAPTSYYPVKSNGANAAINPLTGAIYPYVYAGLFVPGTGNIANGSISVGAKGYPTGLVYGTGVSPAPRFGFAYDPFGDGKTAIRGGFGIFLNARGRGGQEGDMVKNPPNILSVTEYYGNVSTLASAGTLLAPSAVTRAIELRHPILSAYNMSFGIQRKIGFGTVADVAYVGTLGRHLTGVTDINEVAPGTHFLASSQSPVGGVLSDNFLRPYPGYAAIPFQTYSLTSSYHSLQAQLNRQFAHGMQIGAAFTYSKAMDYTDAFDGSIATYINPRVYNYGQSGFDHKLNLTFNYLWDIPNVSKVWRNPVARRAFDGWQVSGITRFVSGAPLTTSFSTQDGADITGGGDAARVVLTCDPNAGGARNFSQWFNTSCFQRPAKGTWGNAPYAPIIGPGSANWSVALFKNVPIREKVMFQLRIETYNTFNHTQFSGVNTAARFSAAGAQISSTFGQVTSAANPRYVQLAGRIRF